MSRLLNRSSRRYLLRHPGILALTVLGVALGVAIVVSIQLAVQSARTSFLLSAETVAGRATHRVEPGQTGLPDSVFRRIRVEAGVRASAPVVQGSVTSELWPGRALTVLGVDPLSEAWFRPWSTGGSSGRADGGDGGLVGEGGLDPDGVVLPASLAAEAGLAVGDSLTLMVADGLYRLPVSGTFGGRAGTQADLLVVDIALAQTVLGRRGLSYVDLILPEDSAVVGRVLAVLPADASLEAAGTRSGALAQMIRGFNLNLTALSLLALLFGMFLIFNAETFAVVQRRALFARLRSVGVSAGEIRRVVLLEALALGVLGSVLGTVGGVMLATRLVVLVTRTINDLYFAVQVRSLVLEPLWLGAAVLLGTAVTVISSLPAVFEATTVEPRDASSRSGLESSAGVGVRRAAAVGAGATLAGAGVLSIPVAQVWVAFAGTFLVVLGMALVAPMAAGAVFTVVGGLLRRGLGITGALVSRGLVRSLSRTGPAVSALVVSVAVTVGLGTMVASFRSTLERWLDQTLQADVYVSIPGRGSNRPEGVLDSAYVAGIRAAPGVEASSTYLGLDGVLANPAVRVVVLDLARPGENAFGFVDADPATAFRAFREENAVLVSEPYAFRYDAGPGDSVLLTTPAGPESFLIAGVFYDYASEHGTIMLGRETYDRFWSGAEVTSVALFAAPGVPVDSILGAARRLATAGAEVNVRSNRALRQSTMEVFDRTFTVTVVLRLLTLGVAFIGILGALMALQLERGWELALLRASGVTPGGLWRLITAETGLLGLVSGLIALPAGLVMAWIMVRIINRRSFGWTLFMDLDASVFLEGVAVAVVGALLAGLYPAWRMARTAPALALQSE